MVRPHRFVCWILVQVMVIGPCGVYAQERPAGDSKGLAIENYITPGAIVAAVAHPRRVLTAPEMEMMPIEIRRNGDKFP